MTFDPRALPASCIARQSPETLRKLGLAPDPGQKATPATTARYVHVLAVEVQTPIRVESVANTREHWSAKGKRNKAQRSEISALLPVERPVLPVAVTFTRLGARDLDDDNLAAAFKALRDEVADWLGVDDGPAAPVTWEYRQERGAWGVRVRVVSREIGGGAA